MLWPPNGKRGLIGKEPDVGKYRMQREKGTEKDEIVRSFINSIHNIVGCSPTNSPKRGPTPLGGSLLWVLLSRAFALIVGLARGATLLGVHYFGFCHEGNYKMSTALWGNNKPSESIWGKNPEYLTVLQQRAAQESTSLRAASALRKGAKWRKAPVSCNSGSISTFQL